jgi:AmmeMemoRadiSam system protein A
MANVTQLSPADKRFLLGLARETLTRVLHQRQAPEPGKVPPTLLAKGACFLTLTRGGTLRGCIGNVVALEPLYLAVIRNACDAAQHDPRFVPIQPNELDQLKIQITILAELEPLAYSSAANLLNQLRVGEHGVVLQIGCRAATFLPQVWKKYPTKVEFLDRLTEKAGCEAAAWQSEETAVSVFHAESFEEENLAPLVRLGGVPSRR